MMSNENGRSIAEKSIAQMQDMMEYFGEKQEKYTEMTLVTKEKADLEQTSSNGLLTVGLVWMAFVILISKGSLSIIIFFSIPSMIMFAIWNFFRKRKVNKINMLTKKKEAIAKELAEHYVLYENCPLGIEYTNPVDLYIMQSIILQGRADTIKEALNIYINDMRVEAMQEELRRTRIAAERAEIQATQANIHASQAEKKADEAAWNSLRW